MWESIVWCVCFYGEVFIKIFVQVYLICFYEFFGFEKVGVEYLEDDILYVGMVLRQVIFKIVVLYYDVVNCLINWFSFFLFLVFSGILVSKFLRMYFFNVVILNCDWIDRKVCMVFRFSFVKLDSLLVGYFGK